MLHRRLGSELSLNVIVIAAIALIVLVVLSVMLLGRTKTFSGGLSQCKGTCVDRSQDCPADKGYADFPLSNCDDGKRAAIENGKCCVPVS
jgi:hypothetical protein